MMLGSYLDFYQKDTERTWVINKGSKGWLIKIQGGKDESNDEDIELVEERQKVGNLNRMGVTS